MGRAAWEMAKVCGPLSEYRASMQPERVTLPALTVKSILFANINTISLQVMPDKKTAYGTDDGTNVAFFM